MDSPQPEPLSAALEHKLEEGSADELGGERCEKCWDNWPCLVARLTEANTTLTRERDELKTAIISTFCEDHRPKPSDGVGCVECQRQIERYRHDEQYRERERLEAEVTGLREALDSVHTCVLLAMVNEGADVQTYLDEAAQSCVAALGDAPQPAPEPVDAAIVGRNRP